MCAEGVLSRYEALINQHDFDLLLPLISKEAIFWFNDGSHAGLVEIRKAFEETWRKFPLERYWLEDRRWLAMGEAAAGCVYRFCWQTTRVLPGRDATSDEDSDRALGTPPPVPPGTEMSTAGSGQ